MKRVIVWLCLAGMMVWVQPLMANGGKLLATAGLLQLEGSGGGGLVPWATLSGYDTRDEWSLSAFGSSVNVDDFALSAWGVSASIYDRVEFSMARQTFHLTRFGGEIRQNVVGVKARLWGDVIYGSSPQIAIGMQHKALLDKDIASALGADGADTGKDVYLAATKVHLGAAWGYNVVWSLALRGTRANQLGLLGFGGDAKDRYSAVFEGSLGVLLSRSWVLGMEYRQKPDNLTVAREDHWRDIFVSYIPSKQVSITLAWVDLGKIVEGIASQGTQRGVYVSLTGGLW